MLIDFNIEVYHKFWIVILNYVYVNIESLGGAPGASFEKQDTTIGKQEIDNSRFAVRSYRHLHDLYLVILPRAGASVVQKEDQLMLILSERFIGFLPSHLAEHGVNANFLVLSSPKPTALLHYITSPAVKATRSAFDPRFFGKSPGHEHISTIIT